MGSSSLPVKSLSATNMSQKRKTIQNVWKNFAKKPKIEEKTKAAIFTFGKEQEKDKQQNSSEFKRHSNTFYDEQSLELNKNSSFIPRFETRSLSIGGCYTNNCSSFTNFEMRRASTTDWGQLVENAFLDQILDQIEMIETERGDNKNLEQGLEVDNKDYSNWADNFDLCRFNNC